MPVLDARQVAAELSSKSEKEIQEAPEEITEFAENNLIYIYNVSPYTHVIMHPMVGRLTIPACEPGQEYSKPAIIKGMVPYGVCVDMKAVEMRHESGRVMAVDLLGLGPFKRKENSLLRLGVFIAAKDTFDENKVTAVKGPGKASMSLPEWVKKGKLGIAPTASEIKRANERFAEHDFAMIAEADKFANDGPKGLENIGATHREALRRRGQLREWAKPLESLSTCPGCGDQVRPGVVVHSCGAVFDWDKAIALGIKKESDRPTKKA